MSKRGANFSTTGVAKNIKKVQMDSVVDSLRLDVVQSSSSRMDGKDLKSFQNARDIIIVRTMKYENGSLNKHQMKEFESAQKVYKDLVMKYSKVKK